MLVFLWSCMLSLGPQEKILEYYWGEHIHLGYYSDEEQKQVRRAGRTQLLEGRQDRKGLVDA